MKKVAILLRTAHQREESWREKEFLTFAKGPISVQLSNNQQVYVRKLPEV